MKIEKNKVIELSYELEVDGAIVDRAVEERPLDYIQGMNMLLPKFEEYLEGKEPGESFAFTLTPAEGYGYSEPAMVLSLPKTAFMLDGKMHDELLVIGKTLPMINQMGNVVNGTVKEILEDSVKMDFNHPLADKTLNFSGKVLSVRDATDKELTEGLHGEFLPHGGCHGGCHGGGDGEGCCGGGNGEGCCGGGNGEGCCGGGEGEGCCGGGNGEGCCS